MASSCSRAPARRLRLSALARPRRWPRTEPISLVATSKQLLPVVVWNKTIKGYVKPSISHIYKGSSHHVHTESLLDAIQLMSFCFIFFLVRSQSWHGTRKIKYGQNHITSSWRIRASSAKSSFREVSNSVLVHNKFTTLHPLRHWNNSELYFVIQRTLIS